MERSHRGLVPAQAGLESGYTEKYRGFDSLPLRQEKRRCACPAHPCAHNKNSLVKIKEKMYPNNMISI